MADDSKPDLNKLIADWRSQLTKLGVLTSDNLAELETSIRDSVETLRASRLSDEEAFLVAARRLGHPSELESEFRKVNQGALWRMRFGWIVLGFIGSGVCSFLGEVAASFVWWIASELPWIGQIFDLNYRLSLGGLATAWAGLAARISVQGGCLYFLWRLLGKWDSSKMGRAFEHNATAQALSYILIAILLQAMRFGTEIIRVRHAPSPEDFRTASQITLWGVMIAWPMLHAAFILFLPRTGSRNVEA